MTTPGTTDDHTPEAEGTAIDVAYAAGCDAVVRLHDEALQLIAHIAQAWAAPADESVVVLRIAERPTVGQRADAAAA